MKRLVLIDGHAILHRAYHAFPKTLRTRRGELVNAVYGFTRILLKVIADLHPEYLAVAFDLPKPTFRHQEFIGYQVQRPGMDEEMKDQIQRVQEVLKALNIPIFTKEGYEADDVIGTLARQATQGKKLKKQESKREKKLSSSPSRLPRTKSRGPLAIETIIVTGDKDIMQLVGDRVKVYAPVKGFSEAQLFGPGEVEKLLGVKPGQIVDYKALVGDASDNYPGVPGIGPKTAVGLLKEYRNLEQIYGEIKKLRNEKVREKLQSGRESAQLSQKLAKIVTNAPVKLSLKACRVHDYDQEKAVELFKELEFKSLIDKLPGVDKKPEARNKKQKAEQMRLV